MRKTSDWLNARVALASLVLCVAHGWTAEPTTAAGATPWPDPVTLSGPGIIPGQLSFNLDKQRRPLTFLVGYDIVTREVTLRTVDKGEIITATLLPHAEIYHHAERGSVSEFRPYQTVRVRLHPDQDGKWRLATYLLDEFWHMSGHKQYQRIDSVAADGLSLTCTVITPSAPPTDKPQQPPPAETIRLTKETRWWRDGKQVDAPMLTPGMSVRCNTYGAATGNDRFAEDVALDDASLEQCFIKPQRERQLQRLKNTGFPGYLQDSNADEVTVLLFRDVAQPAERAFPLGSTVRVQAQQWSGVAAAPVNATVLESKRLGLGWQVRVRGSFTVSEWVPTHTALVFAAMP